MNIYSKFDAATRDFTAQALLFNGQPVGRIVIKFGNAATAFVQIWGSPMATARATGYGYDKASQAVMDAIGKLKKDDFPISQPECKAWDRIRAVAADWKGGTRYASALEGAGFTIANVI